MSARHRIALGLLATVGATPAAAQAAPNWAEPVVIADLPSWSAVALADDELLISRATALSMAPVRTRFELGGSVSGDPFRAAISEDGVPNGANRVAGPLVANAGGAAVACAAVIGETGTGIHGRTVAHHRPSADAPWSTIEFPLDAIADGLGATRCLPAIGADGTAVLLVQQVISETAPNEDQRILVASHRPGTGWSAVTTVTDNSVARERIPLGAAVNDSGAIEIAWIERFGVNRITVKLRTQEAGASFFGQTIDLVANENPTVQIFTPIFATNANGRAALAYQRSGSVRVHTRPGAGGGFGAAVTMANAPDISTSAPEALGISASGDVHVVINAAGSASSDDRTEARRLPVGGGWSAAARIDNPGTQPGSARIAYLDDTAVIVRAGRVGADQRVLQATRWRPGTEGPDGPRDLLPPGSDSLVVHDLQGDGRGSLLASVDRSSGMSGQRLLLPFDAAPPRLRTLNTPPGAIVGVPTALGAEFIDRWSPLGQISWDFGDGTGASGAAVTKTWDSPGIKTVTVTAADALGNSRSVRTEVNVAAVIADPPAPIDRTRPTIALTAPPCGGRARAACARYRAGTVAWRTLRGTARDNAGQTGLRVQVSLVRRDRGRVSALRAGAWRTMTARRANAVWIAARRSGPRWSYRAPRALPPGRYTVRVRAIDRAGSHSRVIVRTVRLR